MKAAGPLLAIRADASHAGGIGHVMRTLAIAQEWQRRGGNVAYLSADMPEIMAERLSRSDIRLEWLERAEDAAEAAAAASRMRANLLLVDHYGLGPAWWEGMPASRRWRTAALNDFADPIHTRADILISPRAVPLSPQALHAAFSGPQFLLIREEVRRHRTPAPVPPAALKLLLVLGGADPRNAGPRVAETLLAAGPAAELRALVGPAATNLDAFLEIARRHPRLQVIQCPPDMKPHLEWADTAVVSPSTTAFEALHHGLATGLVMTAENQWEVCASLMGVEVALQLADARDGELRVDPGALTLLLNGADWRRRAARGGADLVDGYGTARICELLGLPEFDFRPVSEEDSRLTWLLANDPATRTASFDSDPISWENHLAWFRRRTALHDPFWFATSATGGVLAVVRFDLRLPDSASVSLNLAPPARGKGLSALIVRRACERFWRELPKVAIDAWIKDDNIASRRCFEKAGFQAAESEPDRQRYRLSP